MGASTKIGGLTPKEGILVKEFVKPGKDFGNAAAAGKIAFPNAKYPRKQASEALQRPRVQKAIRKLLEDQGLTYKYIGEKLKLAIDKGINEEQKIDANIGMRALEATIKLKERLDKSGPSNIHFHILQEINLNDKKKLLQKRQEQQEFFGKIEEGEEVIGQNDTSIEKEQAK